MSPPAAPAATRRFRPPRAGLAAALAATLALPAPAEAQAAGPASPDAVPPPLARALPDPAPDSAPAARSGPVCGLLFSRGTYLDPVEASGPCGIARPVRLEVAGFVRLDPPPVVACSLARALDGWIAEVAAPAFAADGAPLTGLGIAAGYVCRNVNYADAGELSEHARGRAVDIARFERADGETVSVLDGWGSEKAGDLLATILAAACGPFGTVLGPESDAAHADHVHLDTAERGRPYCPGGFSSAPSDR